jgi:tRNA 2-thiouridine synthesizing protein E
MSNLLPPQDAQGFLINPADWSPQVAQAIADQHQLVLTEQHWMVIQLLRQFYQQYETFPSMRLWVNLVKEQLDSQANSAYLFKLFGENPLKLAAKLAGLPEPQQCF